MMKRRLFQGYSIRTLVRSSRGTFFIFLSSLFSASMCACKLTK
ncbi:hypothetical protein CSUI_009879 [Cystoisospora suis]|uniref:Uncharacterized protein n=1 Tax=Cystoisospora suis TaxID=483139 RepID=A0A2C6KI31_9APIC|nr:hypothetical protein CSUI_009879 [Cystoisospora suis]